MRSQIPMSTHNTIALIEWNIGGHHPSYLKAFITALTSLGHSLCILSHHQPNTLPANATWVQIPRITWIKKRRILGLGFTRLRYTLLIRSSLRLAESQFGARCTKVFFASIYESQAKVVASTAIRLGLPFSGLYVQAAAFHGNSNTKRRHKIQRVLDHEHLDAIYLLDPTVHAAVQLACRKHISVLPEVVCTDLPNSQDFAKNIGLIPPKKPIIGVFGHLTPGKGIVQLVEFARNNPNLEATFLFAGSCDWDEFTPVEAQIFRTTCQNDPRFLLHPHRVQDEADYNLLVSLCDVIWAVYRDFPHSSNTLAKPEIRS
jgi:hypothetical protein